MSKVVFGGRWFQPRTGLENSTVIDFSCLLWSFRVLNVAEWAGALLLCRNVLDC